MKTDTLIKKQRAFFDTGKTLAVTERMKALTSLEQALLAYEERLSQALLADLGKSRAESYMCEIGRASCRERV